MFTVLLIVYTGCKTYDYKYIYLQPNAYFIKANINAPIPDKATVVFPNLLLRIDQPMKFYEVSSLLPAVNTVYATSPPKPTYTPAEHIADIKIFSDYNYDSQHPVGSDLSELCTYSNYGGDGDTNKVDFLSMYNNRHETTFGYTLDHNDMWIRLHHAPDSANATQRFVVKIYTDKGTELVDTTQTITILL